MIKNVLRRIYGAVPYKQNAFEMLRHLHLPQSIYKHLHFKGDITIQSAFGSFKMRHHGYKVENELFWSGVGNSWEGNSLELWSRLCKNHDDICDIGANTGVYALIAQTVNKEANVHAFEPVERVYLKLAQNIAMNEYLIVPVEMAASNFDGTATIHDTGSEHIYSVTVNKDISGEPTKPCTINTCRIDNYFEKKTFPTLFKIDVETHESEVVEGMGIQLGLVKPTLLIEILNNEVAEAVSKQLLPHGYCFFDVPDFDPIRPLDNLAKAKNFNVLACQQKEAIKLGLLD